MSILGDTARTNYNSARQELIQRIVLRDQIILVYLAAVGTLFGVALGSNQHLGILLILPFISLGVTLLVTQHNSLIGYLADFCINEVEPFLTQLDPPENAPQWDNSIAITKNRNRVVHLRTWGQLTTILIPNIMSIVLVFHDLNTYILWIFWSGDIVVLFYIFWVLYGSHKIRRKFYEALAILRN